MQRDHHRSAAMHAPGTGDAIHLGDQPSDGGAHFAPAGRSWTPGGAIFGGRRLPEIDPPGGKKTAPGGKNVHFSRVFNNSPSRDR